MGGEWLSGREPAETEFDIRRDLICTADSDGRFTTLNAAWERILGWSREELTAEPFIAFVHPDDVERTIEISSKVGTRDYELVHFENRYRTKDGGWRWIRWSAHTDGEMWFAVARDITERKLAEERLRRALEEQRLLAYCQPIVDRAGRACQQELLVRLRVDGNGNGAVASATELLRPSEFLPTAEQSGLIGAIDRWMVAKAIAQAAAGRPSEVNLSALSIADEALTDSLVEMLGSARESAPQIVFEITETAALEHFDAAYEFAERVGRLGCRFALDDFGTGFGCFTYLRRLPVRFLKIDSSFVANVLHSNEDRALVRSIVAIARELGQETVAEGVEDADTLALLRGLGVDHAQGYYFGRPSPVEEPHAV